MFYYLVQIIKYLINGFELFLFTLLLYLLSFMPHNWLHGFYPKLFWAWCRFFVRALNIDLRLQQKNTKPLPDHYILVANHPSAFEDIGIPALFNVFSLAKIEVKDWWMVGRISEAAGTLYVHRENKESRQSAGEDIVTALKQGKNIAIYPEGGCKGRRIYKEFRYGAFDFSIRTGVPILPVFLHYESQDDFEWRDPQTLLHKIMHFMMTQNNRVNYYVYDAVDPDNFADAKAFAEHVHGLFLQWQTKYLD